jgi:fructokinase
MARSVLVFGEALWDLLPTGPRLGGAPLNFAARAAALGDKVALVSRLGRDELGRQAHAAIERLGLSSAWLQWDESHPTGTVQVKLDSRGVPDFTIVAETAYDHIETTRSLRAQAAAADGLLFGTLAQRSEVSRHTLHELLEQAGKALKVCDINLRRKCYTKETVAASLAAADVLKLSDGEALELIKMLGLRASDIPGFCLEMGQRYEIDTCLVTLGSHGVFGWSSESSPVYAPGYKVDVADTIGSGDACAAGFVHTLLAGGNLAAACELGNLLGALVATKAGGTPPISPAEIAALRSGSGKRLRDKRLSRFEAA